LVWKLKELKAITKLWVKEHNCKALIHLVKLEEEIKDTLQNLSGGSRLPEEERHLNNLEQERNRYLKEKEELWRQRSRAIWIQSGDQNTKFFHHFASYRRNWKYVWEIRDDSGALHTGQEEIKDEAVKYFNFFFKAQDQPSTSDQVRVAGLFS
jgi:hypothetical protein